MIVPSASGSKMAQHVTAARMEAPYFKGSEEVPCKANEKESS